MGEIKPLFKQKVLKKRTKQWFRHQSDRFLRVKKNWRKPKGIDNRVRRRYKGQMVMPSIGYGTKATQRHINKAGFKEFLIRNPKEVDVLLMQNRTIAGVVSHAVSSRKRKEIIERAQHLGVRIMNPAARIRSEEKD